MDRNRKKGATGKVVAGGVVLLALLGGALGLGLGKGGGLGIFSSAEPAMAQTDAVTVEEIEMPMTPEPPPDAETEAAEQKRIRVNENTISIAGETVTLDALQDKLLSAYDEATPWELIDDHAIKADYDAVKALLDELRMAYIEM